MVEFLNRAGRLGGLTPEDVARLNGDDGLMTLLGAWMREQTLGLIHGRFSPLDQKIEAVRRWPGVTEEMIQAALKEGANRIRAFESLSPHNPLLDIVPVVYAEDAFLTFKYLYGRISDAVGGAIGSAFHVREDGHIRYRDGIDAPTNCVRIELVHLGYGYPGLHQDYYLQGLITPMSAHAAVLSAVALDPEWFVQTATSPESVPVPLMPGFEIRIPGEYDLPSIRYQQSANPQFASQNGGYFVDIHAGRSDVRHIGSSMPILVGHY